MKIGSLKIGKMLYGQMRQVLFQDIGEEEYEYGEHQMNVITKHALADDGKNAQNLYFGLAFHMTEKV